MESYWVSICLVFEKAIWNLMVLICDILEKIVIKVPLRNKVSRKNNQWVLIGRELLNVNLKMLMLNILKKT